MVPKQEGISQAEPEKYRVEAREYRRNPDTPDRNSLDIENAYF